MSSSELLANVALELVGNGSFDDRMNHALGLIGQHLRVSRTYIFLDRPGGGMAGYSPMISPSWRRISGRLWNRKG